MSGWAVENHVAILDLLKGQREQLLSSGRFLGRFTALSFLLPWPWSFHI